MSKIQNANLAGLPVLLFGELVQFDDQGIGDVQSAEAYKSILEFPGYLAVGESEAPAPKGENPVKEPTEEPAAEAPAEEPATAEAPAETTEEAPVVAEAAPEKAAKSKK